jgi:hypothetical protein
VPLSGTPRLQPSLQTPPLTSADGGNADQSIAPTTTLVTSDQAMPSGSPTDLSSLQTSTTTSADIGGLAGVTSRQNALESGNVSGEDAAALPNPTDEKAGNGEPGVTTAADGQVQTIGVPGAESGQAGLSPTFGPDGMPTVTTAADGSILRAGASAEEPVTGEGQLTEATPTPLPTTTELPLSTETSADQSQPTPAPAGKEGQQLQLLSDGQATSTTHDGDGSASTDLAASSRQSPGGGHSATDGATPTTLLATPSPPSGQESSVTPTIALSLESGQQPQPTAAEGPEQGKPSPTPTTAASPSGLPSYTLDENGASVPVPPSSEATAGPITAPTPSPLTPEPVPSERNGEPEVSSVMSLVSPSDGAPVVTTDGAVNTAAPTSAEETTAGTPSPTEPAPTPTSTEIPAFFPLSTSTSTSILTSISDLSLVPPQESGTGAPMTSIDHPDTQQTAPSPDAQSAAGEPSPVTSEAVPSESNVSSASVIQLTHSYRSDFCCDHDHAGDSD